MFGFFLLLAAAALAVEEAVADIIVVTTRIQTKPLAGAMSHFLADDLNNMVPIFSMRVIAGEGQDTARL